MKKSEPFWLKVFKCKHHNLSPNYFEFLSCGTPHCVGAEYHCLDCGVYISNCGCGCLEGLSGWSNKRHVKRLRN